MFESGFFFLPKFKRTKKRIEQTAKLCSSELRRVLARKDTPSSMGAISKEYIIISSVE